MILGGGYYFFTQKTKSANPQDQQKQVQEADRKLIAEIGKLIDLPKAENPTVATISDITKLSNQPFFQKAKNGDKVLIYPVAKKAILYDPVLKKVLEVASVNIGSPSAETAPKVVLRNGTSQAGLTTTVENRLKKVITNLNVAGKENASKNTYEKSLVVLINNSAKDLSEKIARELKAEIGPMPQGESEAKNADVIVILGEDK